MLRWVNVLGAVCAASVAFGAEDLEFRAPEAADGAATAAAMRSLAVRALPVYQNPNRVQFLTNLSALQMVAGEYQAAEATRRSLEEVRAGAKPAPPRIDMALMYDLYVRARAAAARTHTPFDRAFAQVFHDTVTTLSDRDAYTLDQWLTTPLSVFRENLQSALDRLRGTTRLSLSQAVDLAWTYLSFEAFQSFAPLVGPLIAQDDARRYISDSSERVSTADHTEIPVLVIRPRNAGALPTLLEIRRSSDPRNEAKECAAHGYVGVIAYARGADFPVRPAAAASAPGAHGQTHDKGAAVVVPYEHDGEDARAVIEWIAHEPWSDGRVAMYGSGYSAFAAWAAAKRSPAALKALAVASAEVPGLTDVSLQDSPSVPNAVRRRWLKHPSFDRYWQQMIPYGKDFARIDLPVLTITGYYDERETGSLYYFTQSYRYNPHAEQMLLIGPYDGQAMERGPLAVLDGYTIDSVAMIDLHELRFEWFDHILRNGATPGLLRERVNFEVMGANEWRHAESLRAMANRAARLYLDSSPVQGEYRLAGHEPSRRRFVEQKVEPGAQGSIPAAPAILGRVLAPRNARLFLSGPLHHPLQLSGVLSGQFVLHANRSELDMWTAFYELLPNGDYFELFAPPDELCAPGASAGGHRSVAYRSDRLTSVELQTGSRLVLVLGVDVPSPEAPGSCARGAGEPTKTHAAAPIDVRWYAASFLEIPIFR